MSDASLIVGCRTEGCTFKETQVCSRTGGSQPCEFAIWLDGELSTAHEGVASIPADGIEEPVRSSQSEPTGVMPYAPPDLLGFHVGQELGQEDLDAVLNSNRYGRVIAVLGDAKAGKTSLLITIYMLLAAGELDDQEITFAGSLTLPGFETRCRHARVWIDGQAPAAMTARTLIGSERGAGFLHLDLVKGAVERYRLLLSDLPGEWTRDLILQARHAARLEWSRRADAILIVIDGDQLVGGDRWQVEEDQKLLIDRLCDMLGTDKPPLALVATRRDHIGENHPKSLTTLIAYAAAKGFETKGFVICTFASDPKTASGAGVPEVLTFCMGVADHVQDIARPAPGAGRHFGWQPIMSGKANA